MPQEDKIYSTGREAIESLKEDYRDFNDDPEESFEEFAGDVLDIFEAAPDAVFAYDSQITVGSIQRLPEPSREELLGLVDLTSTRLMNRARNCTNPQDMARYALAASWIEGDDAKSLTFLTVKQLQCITIELAKNNRADAADVMGDSALENVVDAYGMLLEDTPYEHVKGRRCSARSNGRGTTSRRPSRTLSTRHTMWNSTDTARKANRWKPSSIRSSARSGAVYRIIPSRADGK